MDLYKKAQAGLEELEEAVVALLRLHTDGLTNNEVTVELGLESDQGGGQENYLAWSILGRLMKNGKVKRENVQASGKKAIRAIYKAV